jgi:hypothetical protein
MFPLGEIVVTPAASKLITDVSVEKHKKLTQFIGAEDCGDLFEPTGVDEISSWLLKRIINKHVVEDSPEFTTLKVVNRMISAFFLTKEDRVWVVTDLLHKVTTIQLPSEYCGGSAA